MFKSTAPARPNAALLPRRMISGYISGNDKEPQTPTPAQKRAVRTYRASLAGRGLARFEVVAREADRELVRALVKELVEDGPQSAQIREAISPRAEKYVPKRGGIYEALRNSPLVGSGVKFERYRGPGRKVDL